MAPFRSFERCDDRAFRCLAPPSGELCEQRTVPATLPGSDDLATGSPLVCDVHVGGVHLAHGVGIGVEHGGYLVRFGMDGIGFTFLRSRGPVCAPHHTTRMTWVTSAT